MKKSEKTAIITRQIYIKKARIISIKNKIRKQGLSTEVGTCNRHFKQICKQFDWPT